MLLHKIYITYLLLITQHTAYEIILENKANFLVDIITDKPVEIVSLAIRIEKDLLRKSSITNTVF